MLLMSVARVFIERPPTQHRKILKQSSIANQSDVRLPCAKLANVKPEARCSMTFWFGAKYGFKFHQCGTRTHARS